VTGTSGTLDAWTLRRACRGGASKTDGGRPTVAGVVPPGFAVLVNAKAGTAEQEAVDGAVAVMARHGPTRVLPAEVDLAQVGDDRLVVAGGDGSLHAVVARLHAEDRLDGTPVALVPLGTGNDFARGAGLPLDPAEAAERAATGSPRPWDLLVDDAGGVVVNAVHAGIGADAAERSERLKGRLGPLAYPVGALAEGVRVDGWHLIVEVDGRPLDLPGDEVLLVGVGNGSCIGGGTPLFPGARGDDGLLDVVVSCATGPAARAAFALALRKGEHLERDDVVAVRGTTARSAGDAIGLDADGELADAVTDRTWTVVPGAWSLVV
jgi:diacylglycerol kinase family enzyme